MKDFIGNKIRIGSYVSKYGGGNTNAKYGQILYRVIDINTITNKVKVECVDVVYYTKPKYMQFNNISIGTKRSWITRITSLVVVDPSEKIKTIFDKICNGDTSFTDLVKPEVISGWIHGSKMID